MDEITLGKKYKDKITGFVGTATGYVQYISGCNQALLVAKATKDWQTESQWFDVQRIIEQPGRRIILQNEETPGCDEPAPVR